MALPRQSIEIYIFLSFKNTKQNENNSCDLNFPPFPSSPSENSYSGGNKRSSREEEEEMGKKYVFFFVFFFSFVWPS
jgi:hypothetical protein